MEKIDKNSKIGKEIIRSINQYFQGCRLAYTKDSREVLHQVCGDEIFGFGTGAHEVGLYRKEFEDSIFGPAEEPFEDIQFQLVWVDIKLEGNTAIAIGEVSGSITINGETSELPHLRATFVFELKSGNRFPWSLIHLHYSFPDSQTEDENIDLRAVQKYNEELQLKVKEKTRELNIQRKKSDELLMNILPTPIANRLKSGEQPIADRVEIVSVLFADIVNFTPLASKLDPNKVVEILDTIFSRFDSILEKHGLEKIKTIGDEYMAVGGIPFQHETPCCAIVEAAFEMLSATRDINGHSFELRIGVNAGEAVAGVIGKKKFIYDLWGDCVNVASRMETQGMPGKIHCPATFSEFLDNSYLLEDRGMTEIKGKGRIRTCFINR